MVAPSPPDPPIPTDQSLGPVDHILIYLAEGTLMLGGHRYGMFLDAAATAAKLTLYKLYRQLNCNVRRTSLLLHVETKRVRAIVKEIETAQAQGQLLKAISANASYYLIALPPLWQHQYPSSVRYPLGDYDLTAAEQQAILATLPPHRPAAQLLNDAEFDDLIQHVHLRSQEKLPAEQRMGFSDALLLHIRSQLLTSGTVMVVESPRLTLPLYGLACPSYSPQGPQARMKTLFRDVASYCGLLYRWTQADPHTLRAIETFDIDPAQRQAALQELDDLLRTWADKYHREGGDPMVLYAAAGERDDGTYNDLFSKLYGDLF